MTASKKLIQAAAGVGGGAFYPYTIDNSCRFNGSSDVLYRTNDVADDATRGAISIWAKRSKLTSDQILYSTWGNGYIYFQANDTINIYDSTSGMQLITTAVYRDISAWYHILLLLDSNNATASDRQKLYINGIRVTDFSTENTATSASNFYIFGNVTTNDVNIGRYASAQNLHFGGYVAQACRTDGTHYSSETDFGEFKNGVWIPKDLSGLTFGTAGWLLDFADSANLGNDVSGNNNDFTSSGLTSSDQMLDTPTNNFNTVNPLYYSPTVPQPTPSEGNLRIASTILNTRLSPTTIQLPLSGKYYWEVYIDGTPNSSNYIGISGTKDVVQYNNAQYPGQYSGLGHQISGTSSQSDGSWITYGVAQSNGNIYQVAVDMDTGKVWLGNNNTWFSSGNPASGTNPGKTLTDLNVIATFATYSTGCKYDINFGQNGTFNGKVTAQGNADGNGKGNFYYSPPSGFLALCTANFPEPAIGPNIDANSSGTTSDEHFNTVLYTGTGSARSVTGFGFQPDNLAIKTRSISNHWHNVDAVRGVSNALAWSWTGAEFTSALNSFDSDGFSVYDGQASVNGSGTTYVAYGWKGNGSGSSNTDGTITSTVSANQDAGFSIVTYTGNATNSTVGHGLNSAPEVVIVKARARSGGSDWPIMFQAANSGNGQNGWIRLNTTDAWATTAILWNNTSPTSSVFSIGTYDYVNDNGTSHVAYCFHSVEGFSKFGSYTGNGSADGSYIYTGFRPAFIVIKETGNINNWMLFDNKRVGYNVDNRYILVESSGGESGTWPYFDILSNGFKCRGNATTINRGGGNYIYMAFAEMPFKYSVGR